MKLIRKKTVAFLGNRMITTPNMAPDNNLENVIRTELHLVIDDLLNEGKCVFVSGAEPGFDMLAAEVVLECVVDNDIELYVTVPFEGYKPNYSSEHRLRYQRILASAKGVIAINEQGDNDVSQSQKIDFLMPNSSEVIAFGKSPDLYAERKAQDTATEMWDLYEELGMYMTTQHPVKQFLQDYPGVRSFKYCREGVTFRRGNRNDTVPFDEIVKVVKEGNGLCFLLIDGAVVRASLISEECSFEYPPMINNNLGLPS